MTKHLLHAEWTKFRTVRGWVIATVAAVLVIVSLGLFIASNSHSSCMNGNVEVACPAVPVGPDGEAIVDNFRLAHRQLDGDGSITARITSMTGIITYPPPNHDALVPGVVPWAKAGVIVKESTEQGSAYAAVMLTGKHGVRMQHNFTHDTAGRPGGVSATSPRWLRLTRAGDLLTGYESADGKNWTEVGTARLSGLAAKVHIGLFTTSPGDLTVQKNSVGGSSTQVRFAQATAVFDQVVVQGTATGGKWSGGEVGGGPGMTDWERYHKAPGVVEADGKVTVTGSGDIAPLTEGLGRIESNLIGAVIGLIILITVAATFITAEYRRGLIRTTLVAGPRRGRVLAVKALVIGAVAFITGLVSAVLAIVLGTRALRSNGNFVMPVSSFTEVRVIVGVAALFAVIAVFALALGALFRRGVAAVAATVAVIVLPYLLATIGVLPVGAAEWLLRLTPAAGFAIQQSLTEYPQVTAWYSPQAGYYPLPPWAGFAVLCGYTALTLALAHRKLRRTDA